MRNSNKFHSIRTKIAVLAILPLLIFSVLLLGYALIGGLSGTVSALRSSIKETANISAQALQKQLEVYETAVQEAAAQDIFQDPNFDSDEAMAFLEGVKTRNGFQRIGYTDENGINQKGSDFSMRQYFQDCRSTLKPTTSDPYASKDNEGALSVLFCAPIVRDGKFCGIVYGASDAILFTNIIKSVVVGTHGENFILDNTGTIIAHTDDALSTSLTNYITEAQTDSSLKPYADVMSEMLENQEGSIWYRIGSAHRIASYVPVAKGGGWVLAVTVSPMDFIAGQLSGLIFLAIAALAAILLLTMVITKLAKQMTNPIADCTKRMELLAEGDLSSEMASCHANDEIGLLVASTQSNIQHLNSMIGTISESLQQMSDGDFTHSAAGAFPGDFAPIQKSLDQILQAMRAILTEIEGTTNVLSDISGQVVDTSGTLSNAVQHQTVLMDEINSAFGEMKESIRENAENTAQVVELAARTRDGVETSDTQMQQLLTAMNEMSELSKEMQSINGVVSDIAFQTHILSINAAIEAAAAGEAGKSFGVVSHEIGRLAAQSGESANKISALIERIAESIQNSQTLTQTVSASFDAVSGITGEVESHIAQISAASEEQAAWMDSVAEKMDTISGEVRNTASSAERSAEISEKLQAEAEELKTHIHQFRL